MPTTDSTHRQLIANPKFEQQLLRLKNLTHDELNIHISMQKMQADKHYRAAVLSELDGVGSELLSELVRQLKSMPAYIHAQPIIGSDAKVQDASPQHSLILKIFAALLLLLAIILFVSWQNGYLQVSLTQQAQPISQAPRVIAQRESAPLLDEQSTSAVLPSDQAMMTLRIHGSNTIGEKLAPGLLEAYLREQGVEQMLWQQGENALQRELQYIQHGEVYAIELHAHGSMTGFTDLLAAKADMAISSRRINAQEVQALQESFGDLYDVNQEYIVGLDGVAVIVHPDNPIEQLSSDLLAQVFSGEITNWRELGGADRAITLYARDAHSGTWDTFNSLLLAAQQKQLSASALRISSSSALSAQVSEDVAAIGFIGLPYVNQSKVLALSATPESNAIYPTRFTIGTEDYVLSRRLYLYAPSGRHHIAQQFSQFVISEAGQRLVEQVGLVSMNIKLERAYSVKNVPQIYNDYAQIASRLSVNFRFNAASNELDNKAKHDIRRLVDYLTAHPGRRVVLMGFSDNQEDPSQSQRLSLLRARQVEKALNSYGLSVTAVEGFGEKLPVASNNTQQGRGKNRRVEVWVF